MRIGLDARFLTHPQMGGFKTYTINLIDAIYRVDDDNEYFIYLDRYYEENQFPTKKNFNYRIVNGTLPIIGVPLREQVLLRDRILKDRLDIFHSLCNTSPVGITIKRIITLHDTIQVTTKINVKDFSNIWHCLMTVYSKWSITQTLRNPGWLITVSEYEKSQILNLFKIPKEKITVTHLATNSIFKPIRREEKADLRSLVEKKFHIQGKYLLGVGYEERKNIPLLIEAFKYLAPDFPHLNLAIVSAESHRRIQFQHYVRDCDLEGRVIILESVSALDLYALYNLANVFVFPSTRESFGLPPLEAISCGTPTVAMNLSSIPEILRDGALLIDGKDAKTWADAIRSILSNEKLRAKMIERGLNRASEFSWERCARETLMVYRTVFESQTLK